MPLDEYRKKRDFSKSPEPSGDRARERRGKDEPLFFCVQKHLASHLHYDFRLEWNGVLLSWAVPKGPSINPADKRLAMQTEDHPFDYGTFEGVIPEGYGAGIVMLWDQGTWTPEGDDVDAMLRKGDLKFRLDGFKLKGSWVLVRTRGFGSGSKPSWLLIKHKDEWAGPIDITEFAPLSVKTPDADFAEILSAETPDIWVGNPPAKGGDTGRMFQSIIKRALEMKASPEKMAGAGQSETRAAKTSSKRATKTNATTAKKAGTTKKAGRKAPPARKTAAKKRA
jgi:DNA ligase D-like protein (predicted 3'-phosphoesterase)